MANKLLSTWERIEEGNARKQNQKAEKITKSKLPDPLSDAALLAALEDTLPVRFRERMRELSVEAVADYKKDQEIHPAVVTTATMLQSPLNLESVIQLSRQSQNSILSELMDESKGIPDEMLAWVRSQQISTLEQAFFCIEVVRFRNLSVIVKYGRHEYPVNLSSSYMANWSGTYLSVSAVVHITDFSDVLRFELVPTMFMDSTGCPVTFTIDEILARMGMRLSTNQEVADYGQLVNEARIMNEKTGLPVDLIGDGIYQAQGFFGYKSVTSSRMGSSEHPGFGCVEKELETEDSWESNSAFVRVFSMELKNYVSVDIRDLREHKYDKTILDRLILSDEIGPIVRTVFESDPEKIFGDLAKGRHGGMVIMASGPPGVGKTFTAESFSEYSERPLYVMSMGELGTNMVELEKNLKLIFLRAARWNAILLFDEAEVFLSKRGTDLERSAIVGVFLRMLDYYRGLFFLTTNMPQMIDDAFLSRITLHLRFGEMSWDVRLRIWERMIEAAHIRATVGPDWSQHKELQINGRQIRNVCRLAKIIHGDNPVSVAELCKVAKLSCQ